MLKIEFWPQRGSFEAGKSESKCFKNFDSLFAHVQDLYRITDKDPFELEDVYIKHYGYETRTNRDCFAFCVGKISGEDFLRNHLNPQCVGYIYVIEEGGTNYTKFGSNSGQYGKRISPELLASTLSDHFGICPHFIEITGDYCTFR